MQRGLYGTHFCFTSFMVVPSAIQILRVSSSVTACDLVVAPGLNGLPVLATAISFQAGIFGRQMSSRCPTIARESRTDHASEGIAFDKFSSCAKVAVRC